MMLVAELVGAFLGGMMVTLAVLPLAAKWYMRRKFGGMLDLLGGTAKK